MKKVHFDRGAVCDDIRQEANGKFIIIGMYTGSFVPHRLPTATQIAFALWGKGEGSGSYKCSFELSLEPDGEPVGGMDMEFELIEGENDVFIPLPKFPVNIGAPGFIVLKEKISGQEVIRLKISPPSNASPPPPLQSQSDA